MSPQRPRDRILVVEDERHLAEGIGENLEAEGYSVEIVEDGVTALDRIQRRSYDLVLLDVMLPRKDGFAVCEEARAAGVTTPILFLTARSEVEDRIRGLQAGGDDYLPKPFHLEELLLRVQVILKRWDWYDATPRDDSLIRFGDNEFDLKTFVARSWDDVTHTLTHKEAMILKALSDRAGEVISREELLETVWGYDVFPSTRTIDNFILRLRRRFEPDPEQPRFFHTVRGVGYRFTPGAESP